MRLLKINYEVTNALIYDDWYLDNINLSEINLVVGKNATGKSRFALIIASFTKMINGQSSELYFGKWELTFKKDEKSVLKYILDITKGVNSEKMFINDKIILDRDKNQCQVFSEVQGKMISISPPYNKLVLHVRRDNIEFPLFEDIVEWATCTHGFKFGNISPHTYFIDKKIDKLTSIDEVPELVKQLMENKTSRYLIQNIVKEFNSLGYNIESVLVQRSKDLLSDIIYVKENGIENKIPQHQLSQGMFRALSLLVFLEYLIHEKIASLIIIDDLCEGLDYERATKLGKLIVGKIENSKIQLIATTNDSFLMDVIPIKYWNILQREGNTVRALNYQNSKELFDKFKLTGLSNFDLFSSDYLLQKQ
jgi:energy-coupling factor transporter ATP-binding protein EcfA2